MPYINKQIRKSIDKLIDELSEDINSFNDFDRDGITNYTFTKILQKTMPKKNYFNYNRKIGILECCKLELYRKPISEYEDTKEKENGEVYG